MPRIYVPSSVKNEAMKIVAGIAGGLTAGVATAGVAKLAKDHHDKVVKKLKENGHTHIVKEDHESAPENHVLLSHTG